MTDILGYLLCKLSLTSVLYPVSPDLLTPFGLSACFKTRGWALIFFDKVIIYLHHCLRSIAMSRQITLRANPAPDDETWDFMFAPSSLSKPTPRPRIIFGKVISLSIDAITLRVQQFDSNRILNSDDPSRFVLLSIDKRFRFPEQPLKVAVDYVIRMFKRGVKLNGVQYRFYGHSNSQLVCQPRFRCLLWLMPANRGADLVIFAKQTRTVN